MRSLCPALVAALAATTIGCSRVKLAYEWLDWALEYQAGKYLDLDAVQEDATEAAVDDYLDWHRRAMLPCHAALFRSIARAQRAGSFDDAAFEAAWADLRAMYDETMTRMAPPLAELLTSQTKKQLAHFEEKLAERQAELVDESKERGAEWREKRLEATFETLEDLVGDLTEQQRRQIAERLATVETNDDMWLQERARRSAVLVHELRSGAAPGEIERFLRAWWLGRLKAPNPEYAAFRERFNDSMLALVRDFLTTLTPTQRRTFADNLDAYAEAFEDLAAEAQPARGPASAGGRSPLCSLRASSETRDTWSNVVVSNSTFVDPRPEPARHSSNSATTSKQLSTTGAPSSTARLQNGGCQSLCRAAKTIARAQSTTISAPMRSLATAE